MKLRKVPTGENTFSYLYNCPGCGYEHAFSPLVHTLTGDLDRPTVSPSLLQSNPQNWHRCHSHITDGKIMFLDDCWHDLRGQTVELPDYAPETYAEYEC